MEQNDLTTKTKPNGVRSNQESLKTLKKKKNKNLILLIALLIVTVVGGITVLIIGPGEIVNKLHKAFTSDASYYQWLEKENTEAILNVLGTYDSKESNLVVDVSVKPGSTVAALLSMKDPILIHTKIDQKDQQAHGEFQLSQQGKDLGNVTAFVDKKTKEILLQIPELSKKYVSFKLIENESITKALAVKALPQMIGNYMGNFLEGTNITLDVKKADQLTIGSVMVKGDKIIADYPLKGVYQQLLVMLKTMKSDNKLQKACEEVGITEDMYGKYLDELSVAITEQEKSTTDEDRMVFTCYVNAKGAIQGRQIRITKNAKSYEMAYILTNKEIAVSYGPMGAEYLIVTCDYKIQDQSDEFEPVTKEQTITAAEYRIESGNNLMSDYLVQLLDKLEMSKLEKTIFSILGLTNQDAGKFDFTLGEYTGLVVEVEESQVTSEDVDEAILNFVKYESNMLPITDRNDVHEGDCVNIDYTGKVDGKDFQYNSATDYEIKAGQNQILEGFDEQLIGRKVGETVIVTAKLPDTYFDTTVAGKEVEFTVKINAIGIREFTDEFVAYNTEYSSTDAYRTYLEEGLYEQKKYSDQSAADDAILQKIVANSEFTSVDQSEINAKFKEMQNTYQTYAEYYGVDMETFAMVAFGLSLSDFYEEVCYYAEQYVKESYVLAKIAELEKIEMSEEEYQELATKSLKEYHYDSIQQLEEKNGGRDKVMASLLEEKTMKFLRENNTIKND
ncbi:MAG: trigger factor [Clostridiales bacterium]|nr:trigger factor [Clostridiales bacterium]